MYRDAHLCARAYPELLSIQFMREIADSCARCVGATRHIGIGKSTETVLFQICRAINRLRPYLTISVSYILIFHGGNLSFNSLPLSYQLPFVAADFTFSNLAPLSPPRARPRSIPVFSHPSSAARRDGGTSFHYPDISHRGPEIATT